MIGEQHLPPSRISLQDAVVLCPFVWISGDGQRILPPMGEPQKPESSEEMKHFAKFIAMVIRNAMEDFHCEHLSDGQMRELNPIIRNSVYTALHAFQHYERSPQAKKFVDFQSRLIPDYWESPEMMSDYVRLWETTQ